MDIALASDDEVVLTVALEVVCIDTLKRGDSDEEPDSEERAEAEAIVDEDAEFVLPLDSCGELDMLTLFMADADVDADRKSVADDCGELVRMLALADALLLTRVDTLGDLLVDAEPLAEPHSDASPVGEGVLKELALTRALLLSLRDAVS